MSQYNLSDKIEGVSYDVCLRCWRQWKEGKK